MGGELGADLRNVISIIHLDDVLHDVVSERIHDQFQRQFDDFTDQFRLLLCGSRVQAALNHAATMAVRTDFDAIFDDGVEDEIVLSRLEKVQTLLDDMITVEILSESYHRPGKSTSCKLLDLIGMVFHNLNHALNRARTVHVQTNRHKRRLDLRDDGVAVLIRTHIDELLAEVISKRIGHQIDNVGALAQFVEDNVRSDLITFIQLPLKHTAASLIHGKLHDIALESVSARPLIEEVGIDSLRGSCF